MESLASLVGLKADEKGLELLFDIQPNVPTALVGDPLRLGQILTNLGNNAVKFTAAGGEILVGVAVREEDEGSVLLHFSVRDSGIGMTEQEKERVFRPFSQADSSTTRRFGGSGLGLVICRKLTELMQGDIWVESEQGQGSTFHFTARLRKQAQQPAKLPPNDDIRPIRVLVVDDNDTARELLSNMLVGFGFAADNAPGGMAAISCLERADAETPYDLVLMDWKMPEIDGIDTVRAIQANPRLSHPPTVIMITAYNRESALQAVQGLELAGFLTKPVTPSTLLESIQRAMGWQRCVESHLSGHKESRQEDVRKLRGARVLLVEDNEINRELALELLVSNGLEVEVATNGEEALAILRNDSFDGVLMDCQMPVMDGYAATRRIRSEERFSDLPVIAMTANAMVGDREKVIEAGMNDHIAKPIRLADMFAVMARWIRPAGGTARQQGRLADATQEGMDQVFPHLPGIDTAAGLSVAQGNERLYKDLLLRFGEQQRDFEQGFLDALARDDVELMARAAHTLKGVAGNLGISGVQAAAEDLQLTCEANSGDIRAKLAAVTDELNPVLHGLAVLERAAGLSAGDSDTTEPAPLLRELHGFVLNGNVEAVACLEKLRIALNDDTPLSELILAVEEYDFDAAVDALATLAENLGIEL